MTTIQPTTAAIAQPTIAATLMLGATSLRRAYWCLRVAAAACFIGHGAFGIITKAAWVPYFGVVGIPKDWAYKLMPIVGTVDIFAGLTVLLSPRPIVLLYMAVWATWTALLRPLAGEPAFEAVERAGNYGAPLALLILLGLPRDLKAWFRQLSPNAATGDPATVARVLLWTTALLLAGHGALAAITGKPLLVTHFSLVGLSANAVAIAGWAEMLVAVLVLVKPSPALLFSVVAWKMASESLYPISGTPIWEFIERAGSYAAPLALAFLLVDSKSTYLSLRRSSR